MATFADNYNLGAELSSDFNAAVTAIEKAVGAKPGHMTNLDDAIRRSALYIARRGRAGARRAVVLVTDNLSPADLDPEKLMSDVLRSEAVFNALLPPINPGTVSLRSRTTMRHSDVRRYVEASGGDTIATTERRSALIECLQRLRNRYTVYFRPDGDLPSRITMSLSSAAQLKYPSARSEHPLPRR